jgi:hypothetical protein
LIKVKSKKTIKQKIIKKPKKKKSYKNYLKDFNEVWNNPKYKELAYSGTAVSTTTSSGTVEVVFGKDSDVYKEWNEAQIESQKYCKKCKKKFTILEKTCPDCGKIF